MQPLVTRYAFVVRLERVVMVRTAVETHARNGLAGDIERHRGVGAVLLDIARVAALHGGPEGFANRVWEGREVDSNGVEFTLNSPHLDENYPGNLCVKVTYHWLDGNILTIDFEAVTDKKTAVNLTNHAYFNLDGENAGTVLNHKLQLHCSRFLPTDDTLIPSGEMAAVEGTPMDFLQPKELGKDIKQNFPALVYGKGYDNCWVVDDYTPGKVREVAILSAEHSGRVLKVYTNQPAAQVYTGNWLAGCPENPEGRSYNDYDGVAIECQGMPDAPHHSNFPNQILNVDEKYERRIEFHFGV